MSVTELRSLARKWQIKGASRLERKDLVPRVLRAECWNGTALRKLRSLAQERYIEGAGRLKKAELIQRLLQTETWEARPTEMRPAPTVLLSRLLLRFRERLAAIR